MPLVEQELLTLPDPKNSRCSIFSVLCIIVGPLFVFWSLNCLFFDLRDLITPLSFDLHLLITPLSVLWFMASDYPFVCPLIYGFWLPLCLSFDLWLLITPLSVLWFTASDYPFGILDLRLLITPLVSSNFS